MSCRREYPEIGWLEDGTMIILVIDEAWEIFTGDAKSAEAQAYFQRVSEDIVRRGRRNWELADEEEER